MRSYRGEIDYFARLLPRDNGAVYLVPIEAASQRADLQALRVEPQSQSAGEKHPARS